MTACVSLPLFHSLPSTLLTRIQRIRQDPDLPSAALRADKSVRPAKAYPSLLFIMYLQMIRDGCGDEIAVVNLLFDERWCYMCDLPLPACTLQPTMLHYFWLRQPMIYLRISHVYVRQPGEPLKSARTDFMKQTTENRLLPVINMLIVSALT